MEESRTQTREKAMFAIYDTLMYENGGMEYEPRDVLEKVFSCAYDDIDIMAREIYIKAILNEDEIISLIEPKLKNWEFKRFKLNFSSNITCSYKRSKLQLKFQIKKL